VQLLALGENRGFSAAANAGIRASRSEYVALLNNDTEVDRRWLQKLIEAAEGAQSEVGLFASKMLDFDNRRILDGAGDALRRSGLPYRLGHQELDRGQYDAPASVFGVCAAAALYRREVFDEVGLFDEDFFAYCEDGDLSFRAQLAGYRCLYVPEATVYHVGGASTGGKRSPAATQLGTQNSLNLLVKNLPAPLILGSLPLIVAGQLSRLLVSSVSPSRLWAHLGGITGALRLLSRMLQKRKEIQKRQRASNDYIGQLLQRSSRQAAVSLRRRVQDQLRLRLRDWSDRFAAFCTLRSSG
jgi:GT2 family glycosyltransferase